MQTKMATWKRVVFFFDKQSSIFSNQLYTMVKETEAL
jgi:hypothetical protein